MKNPVMIVRICLSLIMVFYIYKDTTLIVGIFAFLVLVVFELEVIISAKQLETNVILRKRIERLEQCK